MTSMQPGALLPDTEYYNMSDATTADSVFGHPSMLYAPLYNSSSNSTGDVPGYTAVSKQPISRVLRSLMLQPVIDREFQSDHYSTLTIPSTDTCTKVYRDSTNPRPKGPRASTREPKSLLSTAIQPYRFLPHNNNSGYTWSEFAVHTTARRILRVRFEFR